MYPAESNYNKFLNIQISCGIIFFKNQILKTYPFLIDRYDENKPCIFFGIYYQDDYNKIINHKSYALIIWGGSDSLPEKGWIQKINHLDKNKFFHIAQSKYIYDDLKLYNIKSYLKPWYCVDKNKFNPCIKGNKIYVYLPHDNKNYYGNTLFNIIKQVTKYEFIIGDKKISYDNMPNIYSQCFIGLRLINRDGLGSTVQELGLMGIKCVHNGGSPSALSWNKIGDILIHINNESKKIGTIDKNLADEVDKFLNIDDNFFKVSNYV